MGQPTAQWVCGSLQFATAFTCAAATRARKTSAADITVRFVREKQLTKNLHFSPRTCNRRRDEC